uniref:Evasin n=1 Tax=Rhipicephalus microplus TaxID=6941 RepID=A0A6M2D5N4_RHIMP
MVQFPYWAPLFLIVACCLGKTNLRERESFRNTCLGLYLETPDGKRSVGCQWPCHGTGIVKMDSGEKECLTLSYRGYKCMVRGVNHTCKLGLCGENHECIPSGLFIECWKPDVPTSEESKNKSPFCYQ